MRINGPLNPAMGVPAVEIAAGFQSALRINGPLNIIFDEAWTILDNRFQSALRINGPLNAARSASSAAHSGSFNPPCGSMAL